MQNEEKDYTVFKEFYIAGVQFHELHTVQNEIKVGDNLLMTLEPTNKFDPNAVRIEDVTFERRVMLGYVPKKFSSEVNAAITIGKSLECVVTEINPGAKPWEKCKVEIREVLQ